MNISLNPRRDSGRTHVYISFQKNDFVIHNSKVPVCQSHHNTNVYIIHPQKNAPYTLVRKTKKTYYCLKVYERMKVHVGIETHQIYFNSWKMTNQLIWIARKSMNTILYHFDRKFTCRIKFVFRILLQFPIYKYVAANICIERQIQYITKIELISLVLLNLSSFCKLPPPREKSWRNERQTTVY